MRATIADRRGAVLLTVLVLVILLMIAIAGAYTRTSGERRRNMDATSQVDAFALAQTGIDKYLIGVTTLPSTLPDSQTYALTGGRAVVTLRAIRVSASDTTLMLISRGENTSSNRYASNAAPATRTVAQLVRWGSAGFTPKAGFVSAMGFDKNGNSGSISGVDHCATAPAPLASIPGIAVPSVSGNPATADYTGATGPINGNPDNAPAIIGTPGPAGTAAANLGFNWAGISQRTSITPTYYTKTVAPLVAWAPSAPPVNASAWPIVFVQGNLTDYPSNGQGILIVTGNLTVNGSDNWKGLVLVGGDFTSNGNNTLYGSIYVGLNATVAAYNPPNAPQASFPVPGRESTGNGNKTYQYDSCYLKSAMSQFGGWSRLGNAWVDNFPIY